MFKQIFVTCLEFKKNRKVTLGLLCLGILSFAFMGCETTEIVHYDQVEPLDSYPIYRASGYAVIDRQPGPTADDKTLQAMRASKLDAYRELSEQIFGQNILAETNLFDNVQQNNTLRARTVGIIKGARVIRTYPINNMYVTELELDSKVLYDLYKMRGAL